MRLRIKDTVRKIIKKYKTRDPYEIAEALDVILLHVPLKGVNGFYHYYNRNHLIYLSDTLSDLECRRVLAHELGHLILHKDINAIFLDTQTSLSTHRYEKEADIFASELLISDEDILDNPDFTINQVACKTGTNENYVRNKLLGLTNT